MSSFLDHISDDFKLFGDHISDPNTDFDEQPSVTMIVILVLLLLLFLRLVLKIIRPKPKGPSRIKGTYKASERGVFGAYPLTGFAKFKTTLGMIFIVPIRICVLLPFQVLMIPLLRISLLGVETEGPEGFRRTIFETLMYCWMRGSLFIFGYYWVSVSGKKQLPPKGTSYVTIGNHVGWMEITWMMSQYIPAFVAKSSVKNLPILGLLSIACQTVYIDRLAAAGEGPSVADIIIERLNAPGGAKLGMFPEGSTTNGTHMVKFKTGAFLAGVPVVPMVFSLPYTFFDPCFVSLNLIWHLTRTMAQVYSRMTVKYLDIYYPSEEEKADARLYADNVHAYMIKNAGFKLESSDATYEDKLAWEKSVGYENSEVHRKRISQERKAAKAGKGGGRIGDVEENLDSDPKGKGSANEVNEEEVQLKEEKEEEEEGEE